MGQNILPCIVGKNSQDSEHLTLIPKPHLSTSLNSYKVNKQSNYLSISFSKYLLYYLMFTLDNDSYVGGMGGTCLYTTANIIYIRLYM